MLEWYRLFSEYSREHRKDFFSVTELANATGLGRNRLNTELHRLVKNDLLTRYIRGCYGLASGKVSPEMLLPYLDPGAYITGAYTLFHHQLITQVPATITCFTNRRHGRHKKRETPAGNYEFTTVKDKVYKRPDTGKLASPEQALYDFVYCQRAGGIKNPESLVTFRNLDRLDQKVMDKTAEGYPHTVNEKVRLIMETWKRPQGRSSLREIIGRPKDDTS